MKRITIFCLVLMTMASCEKYDDSEIRARLDALEKGETEEVDNTIPHVEINDGALPGEFSVSTTKKVKFSMGNLEVNYASGSGLEKWHFMSEQYFFRGDIEYRDDFGSWSYNDLLGWGTSGWNSGAVAYKVALSTSTIYSDFYPGNDPSNNLTGEYAQADWGVYNTIDNGGKKPNLWRTLTKEEYSYLFSGRDDANNKWGLATVGSIAGLVLLPDNWELPEGLVFNAGKAYGYTSNTWTIKEWKILEASGAVFLPAAGHRAGTVVFAAGVGGWYWSSSAANEKNAYLLGISADNGYVIGNDLRYSGCSVRLVQDVK
ncbi:MAG: hypothetical protein J6Y55_04155 [Bacteroidales bacterium]|nr:hypothetical protein [Bacteroidales bacterium]